LGGAAVARGGKRLLPRCLGKRSRGEPGETFTPSNPPVRDWDWPFRRLDYVLVRCGEHGGPTLEITRCERFLDEPVDGVWASDHFGVVADLELPRA
jgi:endonuclease/exonuclease/phosphatase family metal-dependent hydrolase